MGRDCAARKHLPRIEFQAILHFLFQDSPQTNAPPPQKTLGVVDGTGWSKGIMGALLLLNPWQRPMD